MTMSVVDPSAKTPATLADATAPLVSARNLTKHVRDGARTLTLLDGVTLDIGVGERVALLGPSGSGKTTLLNILGALDPDFEGEVRVAGIDLRNLDDDDLSAFRNRTLGFIFQSYNLLGHLSALGNVLLPARFNDEPADPDRAQAVLAQVGLGDKAHRFPATLSGGERQRVAIARALYHRPELVLCDEPTGNLDRETGVAVLQLFADLTAAGITLLVATHDEEIAQSAHRVVKLRAGVLQ